MLSRRSFLAAAAVQPAPRRVVRLFDGKSFNGWRVAGHGLWTVEDGALVGRFDPARPGPGYLMSQDTFQNFELNLEFWVSKGGNSGVYVREPVRNWSHTGDLRPALGTGNGYEVQIDYNDPKNLTGSIYNLCPSRKVAGAEERWNRMRIRCQGPVVRVWVEDELLNEWDKAKVQAGCVGLQSHGGKPHDHVVKFRNLTIA